MKRAVLWPIFALILVAGLMLPAATPVTAAPVTVTIFSDTTTSVTEINNTPVAPQNAALAWEPGSSYPSDGPDDSAWANNSLWDQNANASYNFSGSGADWIWDTYRTDGPGADAPKVGRVVRFVKKFDLPCPPSSATLHITADNGYQVWVNGNPVGSAQVAPVPGWATSNLKEASLNSQGWQTVENYTVNPAFFNVGANTLEVLAGNEYFDTDDSGNDSPGTASNNPGGVIFKLDIEYEDCNSCCMQIEMPDGLAAAGAKVNIRYDNPDKDYGDGDSVYLPKGVDIQWQLKVSGFASAWKTKPVDCSPLVVTGDDYCLMTIDIPDDLAAAGAKVNIRYDNPDKDYGDGDSVYLPKGIDIQWQLKVSGFASAWKTKHVDCTPLTMASAGGCACEVKSSSQGKRKDGSAVLPERSDPNIALGIPDASGPPWQNFFSLGFGGSIELKFCGLVGGKLTVYEITGGQYPLEKAEVYGSPDGVNWTLIGIADNTVGMPSSNTHQTTFDLGDTCILYVKIVDVSNPAIHPNSDSDAFDLDAVCGEPCTSSDSCNMHIEMPDDLAAAGAKVNIRYDNPDKDYGDGDSVILPTGKDIQWQLKVSGFASAWKTKPVDCSPLVVTDADYCLMTIQMPDDLAAAGAKVNIRYDSPDKDYGDGESVYLPKGIDIQWQLKVGGFASAWKTKKVDCTPLAVTDADYCLMTINIPDGLAAAGAKVNIRYDNPDKNFGDGDSVYLPKGVDIQWQLKVSGFASAWKTKKVDCTPLAIMPEGGGELCWQIGKPDGAINPWQGALEYETNDLWYATYDYTVGVDADPINAPSMPGIIGPVKVCDIVSDGRPCIDATKVLYIHFGLGCDYAANELTLTYDRYGSEDDELYLNGNFLGNAPGVVEGGFAHYTYPLPEVDAGSHVLEIRYVGGGAGNGHYIDYLKLEGCKSCGYCLMTIQIPTGLATAGAKVNIRYDNPDKDYGNSDMVYLPKGIDIQWQLKVGGFASAWKTKPVDCSPLAVTDADYCLMTIEIPDGAKVDIRYDSPNKEYVNGDSVYLPKGIDIQWQLKVSGFASAWKTKSVDCTPLAVTDADYCLMPIQIPDGAKVDIRYDSPNKEYVNGDSVYLPKGISIEWKIYIGGSWSGWQTKNVDCSPLVYPPS